jgi:glycosyltransferase involved in cell wall biosynthesis
LRIAVNTRFLIENKLEGIGWFSFETLKRITQNHPEHKFFFFFDRAFPSEFVFAKNVTPVVLFPPARHPFLYYLFFEFAITKALRKYKIDYFLSTDGFLPMNPSVPSLAVIHDINFEHRPDDLPLLTKLYYRYFFPKFAKDAKRIATVSEFSKNDLMKTYGISAEKIDVVYNGANEAYSPIDEHSKEKIRAQYSNGQHYFVYLGSLNPRKNIRNLLLAFEQFKQNTQSDFKLLIVGAVMHNNKDFENIFEQLNCKSDVVFCGRLNTEQLHMVIASAYAMTYIPFYEGFGIPILESMYCEVPVITSNTTSLPEVAADAAILVDPTNVGEIANAMNEIILNKELYKDLIVKSKERKNTFSWSRTAALLYSSLEKMMSEYPIK